jgi:hypothetical protein
MDATQYSEPLLDSACNVERTSSITKMHDTSSDNYEYEASSHQCSFNGREVISTAVIVEESSKEEWSMLFRKHTRMEPRRVHSMQPLYSVV